MRKFILWDYTKANYFDFEDNGMAINDIKGLGYDFSTTETNGIITNYERKFDDISFGLIIGINANPYTKFTALATFISLNGKNKFILEYQFNGKIVYADVWVTKVSKTQKTTFNIMEETMVLKRITEWHTMVNGIIPVLSSYYEVTNPLFSEMPVTIYAEFSTNGFVYIGLYNPSFGTPISAICINALAGDTISIYSDKKKVTCTNTGIVTNGYNKIHRSQDTFLMVPQGTYRLAIYNSSGTVMVSCFYGRPVLD